MRALDRDSYDDFLGVGKRVSHSGPHDVCILAGGTPALEESLAGISVEDRDEWDSAGGGDVLSGGVVATVKARAGDDPCEPSKGALPVMRIGRRALDSFGFFATGAFIDPYREFSTRQKFEECFFERIGHPLVRIAADAETDRDIAARFRRLGERNKWSCAGYSEGFGAPGGCQFGERESSLTAVGAAFEEAVLLFAA